MKGLSLMDVRDGGRRLNCSVLEERQIQFLARRQFYISISSKLPKEINRDAKH